MNLVESGGSGTHWVAWVSRENIKVYFDSNGLKLPNEMSHYLKEPFYHITDQVKFSGVHCGHLCLFILKTLNADNDFNLLSNFQSSNNELIS